MNVPEFRSFSIGAFVALLLCGCASASQPPVVTPAIFTGSWMENGAAQHDLLYVANENGIVNVYRYWQRTLAGVLTDFDVPLGICSASDGSVYIADYRGKKIVKYAHGGRRPIATIDTSPDDPYGCAVDQKTGNLAVANVNGGGHQAGSLAIYVHGTGKPTYYTYNYLHFISCAYDDRGDLLATGDRPFSGSANTSFLYLPRKSHTLINMNLAGPSQSWLWGEVDGVAWDGKYWVVDYGDLYLYTINVQAQYVGVIDITATNGFVGPIAFYRGSIHRPATQVVAGSFQTISGKNAVDYWMYPKGGNPFAVITKDLDQPYGVGISLRP